jgi:prefoldin subunit 5
MSPEEEKKMLKDEVEALREEMKAVEERLKELEKRNENWNFGRWKKFRR